MTSTLRNIFIGAILFFILALAFGWYFIFYKKPVSTNNATIYDNPNTAPFGQSAGNSILTNATSTSATSTPKTVTVAKLTELSKDPVAGATTITSGSTTIVRYVQKGTGYIFDVNLQTGTSSQVSNTTIPFVYEALWTNNNTVILRYSDSTNSHIISYSGALIKPHGTSTVGSIQGTYLPNNIESITTSPDGKKLFSIVSNTSGEQGIILNPDGSKPNTLFNSSFGEWTASWPNASTIALSTKPASGVGGYLYTVDTGTHLMKKIIDAVPGMIGLVSPDGKTVVYSDDHLALFSNSLVNGSHIEIAGTLAEKCVWSHKFANTIYCAVPQTIPSGLYPDAWYQGLASFTDAIYKIDTSTGTNQLIADIYQGFHADIDAINLSLSSDENYLIFTNKKDYSLWSLRTTN